MNEVNEPKAQLEAVPLDCRVSGVRRLKPWHIRIGRYGRAFVQQPSNPLTKVVLWLRGWRHTHWTWWSKPSRNQRRQERIEQNHDAIVKIEQACSAFRLAGMTCGACDKRIAKLIR